MIRTRYLIAILLALSVLAVATYIVYANRTSDTTVQSTTSPASTESMVISGSNAIAIQDMRWEQNRIIITASPTIYTKPRTHYVIELKAKDGESYSSQSYWWGNITDVHIDNPEYYITRSFPVGEYTEHKLTEEAKPLIERKTSQELMAKLFTITVREEAK